MTKREQDESSLTVVLRAVAESDASLRAVVFVDQEGECIDYWADLDPFDAKIAAAQMIVVLADASARLAARGFGPVHEVTITSEETQLVATWVSEEYFLVLLRGVEDAPFLLRDAVEQARLALRRDAALPTPAWERRGRIVDVTTRGSSAWPYAPVSFRERGEGVEIEHVLGCWDEDGQTCFRVRTADGRELTLAHDPTESLWTVLGRE